MEKQYKLILIDTLGFEHEYKRKFPSRYAAKKIGNKKLDEDTEHTLSTFRVEEEGS